MAFRFREPQDTLLPGMLGHGFTTMGWRLDVRWAHGRGGLSARAQGQIPQIWCVSTSLRKGRSLLPQEGSAWVGASWLRKRSAINKGHSSLQYITLPRPRLPVLFWILKKPIFTFCFLPSFLYSILFCSLSHFIPTNTFTDTHYYHRCHHHAHVDTPVVMSNLWVSHRYS